MLTSMVQHIYVRAKVTNVSTVERGLQVLPTKSLRPAVQLLATVQKSKNCNLHCLMCYDTKVVRKGSKTATQK